MTVLRISIAVLLAVVGVAFLIFGLFLSRYQNAAFPADIRANARRTRSESVSYGCAMIGLAVYVWLA